MKPPKAEAEISSEVISSNRRRGIAHVEELRLPAALASDEPWRGRPLLPSYGDAGRTGFGGTQEKLLHCCTDGTKHGFRSVHWAQTFHCLAAWPDPRCLLAGRRSSVISRTHEGYARSTPVGDFGMPSANAAIHPQTNRLSPTRFFTPSTSRRRSPRNSGRDGNSQGQRRSVSDRLQGRLVDYPPGIQTGRRSSCASPRWIAAPLTPQYDTSGGGALFLRRCLPPPVAKRGLAYPAAWASRRQSIDVLSHFALRPHHL